MALDSATDSHPTFGDLVRVVDDLSVSQEETIVVVDHLLRSGRVRLSRLGQARRFENSRRDGRVVQSAC